MKEFYRKDAEKATEEAKIAMYSDILEKVFDTIRKESKESHVSFKADFLTDFTWSVQNDIIDLLYHKYGYSVHRDGNNSIIIGWWL